jgi:hypothetical protein
MFGNEKHLEIDPSFRASLCVETASLTAFGQHSVRKLEIAERTEGLKGMRHNCGSNSAMASFCGGFEFVVAVTWD